VLPHLIDREFLPPQFGGQVQRDLGHAFGHRRKMQRKHPDDALAAHIVGGGVADDRAIDPVVLCEDGDEGVVAGDDDGVHGWFLGWGKGEGGPKPPHEVQ